MRIAYRHIYQRFYVKLRILSNYSNRKVTLTFQSVEQPAFIGTTDRCADDITESTGRKLGQRDVGIKTINTKRSKRYRTLEICKVANV